MNFFPLIQKVKDLKRDEDNDDLSFLFWMCVKNFNVFLINNLFLSLQLISIYFFLIFLISFLMNIDARISSLKLVLIVYSPSMNMHYNLHVVTNLGERIWPIWRHSLNTKHIISPSTFHDCIGEVKERNDMNFVFFRSSSALRTQKTYLPKWRC